MKEGRKEGKKKGRMDFILSDEFKILKSPEILLTAYSKWRNITEEKSNKS